MNESIARTRCLRRVAFATLLLFSFGALAEHYTVPLLVPAGTSSEPQGVLRILNATDESGAVEIYAIDDAGTRSGPATFTLNASAAVQFTATDLASGNATLGLTGGIGSTVGDARLQIETDLDIVPLAFVRAADGTLSSMHDTVRGASSTDGSDGYIYEVPIFNPASDVTQVSRLRLINPGDAAAAVTIGGRDDSGAVATGGEVTLTLAAGGAQTLTAQQLEAGDTAITGRLGAGTGKWRLTVTSDRPLQVVNIVAATAGYWNNLSTTAAPGAAPVDLDAFNERFVGNAVVYVTGSSRFTLNAQMGERFTETAEVDGVSTTYMGSYDYSAIGAYAGRLTLTYDDADVCAANLYFSTHTAGWFASHCTGSDYPAAGTRQGGSWSVEDDEGGGGEVTDTLYGVDDALPGVPASGLFIPSVTSGGSVAATADGTTITLNNGGYFELSDGTRYTCTSADGCTVANGTVTAGTVTGPAPDTGEVDRFPTFRGATNPGDQTYTVGTAIDALTLPAASGGNGALTYSLSPNVPGLSFSATSRQLTGTPSTADTYAMTYTVTDEDGDTDTLSFTILVEESGGAGAPVSFGLDVDSGNGSATGIVHANERFYVVDSRSDKVFAYSASGLREVAADFDLDDANILPDGIAYANERFYIVDWFRQKVYGYSASGQRDASADFDLDGDNGNADGIAYANGRFYVVDRTDRKVYAYSASGQRDASADFDLHADNLLGVGVVYANERLHVVDSFRDRVYAYTDAGQRDESAEFDLHEDNNRPDGIGYADDLFYVLDTVDDTVYAYAGAAEPQDTSPSFASDAGPGDQTYTVGTAIATLTLPEASGGDGTLTYSLSPEVPGLSFDAAARQLTGTPTAAGVWTMAYQVRDASGDTDFRYFNIAVEAATGGQETTHEVGDTLSDLPTGSWFPDVTSGGSFSSSAGNTTVNLDEGGYIEEGGHRYTCQSSGGCVIENRNVTSGTVVQTASGTAPGGSVPGDHSDDRAALMALYNATDGPNWANSSNWGSSLPLDQWHGVSTDDSGRVTNIALALNRLSGPIPAELGSLSNLQELWLDANQLSGSIPAELGDLSSLETLWLSTNQLSGPIPAELGGLSNLQSLAFSVNQLSGPIPAELGSLSNLQSLAFSVNQLSGPIPAELGSLSNLENLYLNANQLSGSIPAELGGLSNLQYLSLTANQLSGPIPAELGSLSNLESLYLSYNQLSGSIPAELGDLSNLEELRLNGNRLSGCIPDGLRDVARNDLSSLGLAYCGDSGTPGGGQETTHEVGDTLSDLPTGSWVPDVTSGGSFSSSAGNTTVDLDEHGYIEEGGHRYTCQSSGGCVIENRNVTSGTVVQTASGTAPGGSVPGDHGDDRASAATVAAGSDTQGDLTAGDVDYFRIVLDAPGTLEAYTSGSTDTLGRLEDDDGDVLRTNDDGGAGMNFRISEDVSPGTYFVRVEGFSGQVTGEYTLHMRVTGSGSGTETDDRAALMALYNATDGPNWANNSNWGSSLPLDRWRGVSTDDSGRVTSIALIANRLSGPIPAELGGLSNLDLLALTFNQLSGSIPAELGDLSNLKLLHLIDNDLSGPIPVELGGLSSLEELGLGDNQLSGPIPAELGSLSNLDALSLSANQLSGSIPAELGNLSNLEGLFLSANQLSGSIPAELGSLSKLEDLFLSANQLSGSIPAELGSLSNLEHLNLSDNQLSGSIPAELGSLPNLERLFLSANQLSGSIPAELGNLSNLEWLWLSDNQLSGPIPAELGSLSNLERLNLNDNQLSDPIPAELGSLSNLERLDLSANQLSGSIPAELGSLSNLERLDLSDNQLSDPIPAELGSLSNLERLDLSDNQLSDPIPAELGNLSNLEELRLNGNRLSGCIPDGLRDVARNDLSSLGLAYCGDSGTPGGGQETTHEVGDTLSDLPTGSWFPDVTSGGSFSSSAGNTTVNLSEGGYIDAVTRVNAGTSQ